jgi:hypothetical protein
MALAKKALAEQKRREAEEKVAAEAAAAALREERRLEKIALEERLEREAAQRAKEAREQTLWIMRWRCDHRRIAGPAQLTETPGALH